MNYRLEILARETLYRGFFRLERYRLRHERFRGGLAPPIEREVFARGHAAAVLPYDPRRDEVVLIEQFRIGALSAPGGPWLVEIVAGIIEPGEGPEAVARREAREESGCELGRLERVAEFIPSPSGCSERIHLYCGEVDARAAGGVHGVEAEGEDIRVSVVGTDEALALIARGRIVSATPLIALQWLALHREQLRARWLAVDS